MFLLLPFLYVCVCVCVSLCVCVCVCMCVDENAGIFQIPHNHVLPCLSPRKGETDWPCIAGLC